MFWNTAGCLGDRLSGVSDPANASVSKALAEFQAQRIESAAREVLFSRHLGRLKQGLDDKPQPRDWFVPNQTACQALAQANMPSFPIAM